MLELRVRVVVAVLLVLAGKAITLAMPFAYKAVVDAMSGDKAAVDRGADAGDRLCRSAVRRGAGRQSAQRPVREGRAECGAAAGGAGVPPRPLSVAALPPRAAHRQPDQDRRARHQEHRHDALFPAVQHRPDGDRAGRDLRHLLLQVRGGTGRGDAGDRRALYRLHPQGDRLADQAAARDERGRQPGDRPGGRQPAEL